MHLNIHCSTIYNIDTYSLLYIKQTTNKDLLTSTGNSIQHSVMAYVGKKSKKEWVYVYV